MSALMGGAHPLQGRAARDSTGCGGGETLPHKNSWPVCLCIVGLPLPVPSSLHPASPSALIPNARQTRQRAHERAHLLTPLGARPSPKRARPSTARSSSIMRMLKAPKEATLGARAPNKSPC